MNMYDDTLRRLASEGNFRSILPDHDNGMVDLSSNDYLGLGTRPDLQEGFLSDATRRATPLTSSASRLLAGRQREYMDLERLLADLYSRKALLFNSGYHANTGLVSALASEGKTLIVADRLVHASIIDGMVLSKAPFTRFRHNDISHLAHILAKEHDSYDNLLVIVESVYSMDGDQADISSIASLKERFPKMMLYVDEAHAFGVVGDNGLGLCRGDRMYELVDVIVGTFGKACASMGAFAILSPALRDYAVNRARSLIFSTSLPPMQAAWTTFIIGHMLKMDSERTHLKALGRHLHSILSPLSPGFRITPGHIQPFVTGDAGLALRLSSTLAGEGFKVLPIRTPTVPPGTERLRISLSAALSVDDIGRFGQALTTACGRLPTTHTDL